MKFDYLKYMPIQKPLIAITTCASQEGESLFYKAGDKYIQAIRTAADSLPLLVPALAEDLDIDALLKRVDGLLFTGSPSNVAPSLYGGTPPRHGNEDDPIRDATNFRLLAEALDKGVPIFCICRGHQELNVALGGSLHQHVHELAGKHDHRQYQDGRPLEESYAPRHPIFIQAGGRLEKLCKRDKKVQVNSLHSQAIDRIAHDLHIEALSDDGIIEAVSMPSAKSYVLSVQWHPEHPIALETPLNRALFANFRDSL